MSIIDHIGLFFVVLTWWCLAFYVIVPETRTMLEEEGWISSHLWYPIVATIASFTVAEILVWLVEKFYIDI